MAMVYKVLPSFCEYCGEELLIDKDFRGPIISVSSHCKDKDHVFVLTADYWVHFSCFVDRAGEEQVPRQIQTKDMSEPKPKKKKVSWIKRVYSVLSGIDESFPVW